MPCDTITVEKAGYTVTVDVSGPADTEVGAEVELDGDLVGKADSNGNLEITGVQSGTHTFEAWDDTYYYYDKKTKNVTSDMTVNLTLEYVGGP